jgi:site-specific DNA-methyltransferase (adenine-specific)
VILSDAHATVLRGDALAVLGGLPACSVDAVVTDPPYSSGGAFRGDRMTGTATKYTSSDSALKDRLPEFTGDNRDQRAYGHWSALWLAEALRVTKPGGVVAVFTDWRQLPTTTDAVQAGGWVWRGVVPWVKPTARPCLGRFTNQCEYIVWGSNGPMPVRGSAHPGFFRVSAPASKVRAHPTEKPLDLMRALVRVAPEGGTVLDPFTGSGSTGLAALAEGRNFVGVEASPHYAEVAEARLRGAA